MSVLNSNSSKMLRSEFSSASSLSSSTFSEEGGMQGDLFANFLFANSPDEPGEAKIEPRDVRIAHL